MFNLNPRLALATVAAIAALPAAALAVPINVRVTNIAPSAGTYITPVWIGFHDGSFDVLNAGGAASAELQALAEDGNTAPLSASFAGHGVDATLGSAPIGPGDSVQMTFDLADDGSNAYLSFGAMVLPSSDFFIGNDNPRTIAMAGLLDGTFSSARFNVVRVYDAGTEVNDFATSAGNALFGIPGGQTGPNQGADQNGVVAIASGADYAAFLNASGVDIGVLDFDTFAGVARIDITRVAAVPLPAAWLLGLTAAGALARRVRLRAGV